MRMPGENIESVRIRNSNVVDVYSFGMVCYEILSGKVRFSRLFSMMICRNGFVMVYDRHCLVRVPEHWLLLLSDIGPLIQILDLILKESALELRHIKAMLITGSYYSVISNSSLGVA